MKKIYFLLIVLLSVSTSYGQLFITELADPQDATTCRYVEIYNAGSSAVDLSTGYKIQRYTNGNASPQTAVDLTGTIAANGFYIIARDGFSGCYGFTEDLTLASGTAADSNGDDQIQLLDPSGAVLDLFGVVAEDGTGTCHEYLDGRAERIATVTTGNGGTWNEANWNTWTASSTAVTCTSRIPDSPQTSTTGNFDPGAWVGFVPTNTTVSFVASSLSIAEDGTSITVDVEIANHDGSVATTVEVELDGGSTTTNGADYSMVTYPQTLTFAAGSSSMQSLTFTITDDSEVELTETIVLILQNAMGGSSAGLGSKTQHTVSINDNDLLCPSEGDLIFSEIMQNPSVVSDGSGEWFEIYNTTSSSIDLFAMEILDDATASEKFTITTSVIVPANGYVVFVNNGDAATNGGITPDFTYSNLSLANGSDGLVLQCSGNLIDQVLWDNGATFPDPTGASMSLDVGKLNNTDNDTGENWCEGVDAYGDGDLGTPGTANPVCPFCELTLGTIATACDAMTAGADTYSASIDFTVGNTGVTYVIMPNSGSVGGDDPTSVASGTISITGITEGADLMVTIVGGECDFSLDIPSAICVETTCANVGDIIFTEIMQNPSSVSDGLGEWFELYNTTGSPIDLQGWTIIDDDKTLFEEGFIIAESLVIPANGYLLFANNADVGTNGGLPTPNYVYPPGFPFLGNGADGITIQCAGTIIDQVVWDGGTDFPDPSGASMSLDVSQLTDVNNDDGTNWCEGFTTYGDGDFGTPGTVNDACPVCELTLGTFDAACDAITSGSDTYSATIDFTTGNTGLTYSITPSSGTVSGDDPSIVASGTINITGISETADLSVSIVGGVCDLSVDIPSPQCIPATCAVPGDIIFTEIMQNPDAVADGLGEWFEIHNTTSSAINLEGWSIIDDNHTLAEEGFVITTSLMIDAGGYLVFTNNPNSMTNGGITPDYSYDPSLTIGNGIDGITIQCAGTIIDEVVWDDGVTFPDPTGASMALANDALNDAANDIGANWLEGTSSYGDGDLGTPGAMNEAIPLGIQENQITGFSIYPNSVSNGIITLTSVNASAKYVEIIDLLGRIVYEMNVSGTKITLDLGDELVPGTFVVRVTENGKVATRRLLIE